MDKYVPVWQNSTIHVMSNSDSPAGEICLSKPHTRHIFSKHYRGGRRWTCVCFDTVSRIFGLAVGIIKHTGDP